MKELKKLVFLEYLRLWIIMVVIDCYLERKNYTILTFFDSTGFFAVRMSTDGIFLANYTISFLVSFAFCLLDFLRLLLMVFKYLAYLVFLIKCFFRTQNCAFPMSKGLVNTPVLNIPLFLRKSFIFKDVG